MTTDKFATQVEDVAGHPMSVYRNRLRSLHQLFDERVSRYHDRDHVVHAGKRQSFGTLDRRVQAMAAGLAARGVDKGDRVAMLAANHPAWIEALWASTRLGAVLCGLNGWWAADEICYAIEDSRPKLLIIDRRRLERIVDVLPALGVEVVAVVDEDGAHMEIPGCVVVAYEELFERTGTVVPTDVDEDDTAVVLYTSGTTGRSKGAMWTHRGILAALQSRSHALSKVAKEPPLERSTTAVSLLVTVPMFHTSGLFASVITGLAIGAKLVIPEGRFDPERVLELIEQERITAWGAVPTMLLRVLDHPRRDDFDLSSLSSVSYGGAPAPPDLRTRCQQLLGMKARIGNAYGLTETTAPVITIDGADYAARPDSVGRPHPCVDVRVVDDSGVPVPTGVRGELQIRGPMLMSGYWRNDEATAAAFDEGWLRTGDVAIIDEDGYVFICDRIKDVIIRGGENVYSIEVENRINDHPDVTECAVFGIPHADLGEEIAAVVRSGLDLSHDEVRAWVAETLAPFKVPTKIVLTAEPLPRNATGKILKPALRETFQAAHTTAAEHRSEQH